LDLLSALFVVVGEEGGALVVVLGGLTVVLGESGGETGVGAIVDEARKRGAVGFTMEVGCTDVDRAEDVVFDGITGAGAVGAVVGGTGACSAVVLTGTGTAVVLVCM